MIHCKVTDIITRMETASNYDFKVMALQKANLSNFHPIL